MVATVLAACSSGDDGEAEPTTTATATTAARDVTTTTTEPEATTTEAPATTPEPTDPPETAPPTTTEQDLKAQIAADYARSWELRNELVMNPTLDDLDARVAEIAAVGTPEFDSLKAFVEELVALGERIQPNDPDTFSITVEAVTLEGSEPYERADVTFCYVDNRLRVDAQGASTGQFGAQIANRSVDSVALTQSGWLPDGELQIIWSGMGVTQCPPA